MNTLELSDQAFAIVDMTHKYLYSGSLSPLLRPLVGLLYNKNYFLNIFEIIAEEINGMLFGISGAVKRWAVKRHQNTTFV